MSDFESFERWVSIGNFCLTKYQINRYIARNFFGLIENSTLAATDVISTLPKEELHNVNGGNLFFDWTVVEDYNKVISMLKSGFDYELSEGNLSEKVSPDGAIESIRCAQSGVQWVHLFSRENKLLDWKDQIPGLKNKVEHLRSEFVELKKFKTLYIVTLTSEMISKGIPQALDSALSELRGGATHDFKLLVCVSEEVDARDSGRVLYRSYRHEPDHVQYPWLGNASSWDNAFEGLLLRPTMSLDK
ncbi:hypothetical protein [Massilia timonae]|uniref:hypothetical protein n=1 Tax=Massilia timonae TaxID=47229 RepID=UPI0023570D36|nr:hypothetical protein [Massilia timonae]